MKNTDAFTGLEAVLILIAFVVVAAAFSFVTLNTGFFTIQKSQKVIYDSVDTTGQPVITEGAVYGLANDTSNKINRFRITIGSPYRSEYVKDLNNFKITFTNYDTILNILPSDPLYNSSGPEINHWAVVRAEKESGADILSGTEKVTIEILLSPEYETGPKEEFRISIIPEGGAPFSISSDGPDSIKKINIIQK
ncbi:archaellin/type IV pilin N-terminal domain-containing protein [Methanoplanus endosymbiosus]|uniref:Flagellin n=1 Tax=Methanoplanus endosymbiosus TaxID=33865 RepID=A0A9E7TJH8_9EURY|nr:archaellin/type IV pilin N-terminal domain-containing protein [Methanoplanus endosymbiosus]UUX93673.1 hypothetical protein L6E24_06035 [Methanoplanus endosymbiosus]